MEDNVQGSRQGSRVLEMLEQCVSVPSGDCHTGYHISDGRKGIGMKDRYICEFCKGRLIREKSAIARDSKDGHTRGLRGPDISQH